MGVTAKHGLEQTCGLGAASSGSSASEGPAPGFPYRGRIAPSPTGYLHLGHARTFWIAQEKCLARQGTLVLRNEDLDPHRCRPEFARAMLEDLRWFGFQWQEGPDCGGPFGPYEQSSRRPLYLAAFQQLLEQGALYPCRCSRREVQQALQAPHQGEEEPVYPGTCRNNRLIASGELPLLDPRPAAGRTPGPAGAAQLNWRFRVPEGEEIRFVDGAQGPQAFMAGRDFGDFVVWRQDDVPSYQLAVVVDDAAMQITEVVRGADLLLSTARQLLLLRALGWRAPSHHHCPLMVDEKGVRLAKRHDSLSLRSIRGQGVTPESLRAGVLFAQ